MLSKAQVMLAEITSERGAQSALAAELGVHRSLVSRWKEGRQSPTTRYRIALSRGRRNRRGIPVMAWDEPADATATPPSAA